VTTVAAREALGSLVRTRRQALGLTLQQLAEASRCAKSYLSTIENGRRPNPPSDAVLMRLERALGLAEGRLVNAARWESTPESVRAEFASLQSRDEAARRLASLLQSRGLDRAFASGELSSLVATIGGGQDLEAAPPPVRVPVINKVAAGYPAEFTDLGYPARVADEWVQTPDLRDPDAFAARVVGDSMAPRYTAGDIVVFSPERDTPPGADCFVRLERDSESTFKRVFFETDERGDEWIRLQPLNDAYPAKRVRREDVAGMYAAAYVVKEV
jgi:phage repressor protein C with HTH and peptisase S24 domain